VYIRAVSDGNGDLGAARLRKSGGVAGSNRPMLQTAASATCPVAADAPVQITVNSAPVRGKPAHGCGRALAKAQGQAGCCTPESTQEVVRQPVPRSVDVPSAPITQAPVLLRRSPSNVCRAVGDQPAYSSGSRTKGLLCVCGPQSAPILPSTAQAAVTGTARPSRVWHDAAV